MSSRRFFSKFNPEIFVDFVKILTQIRFLSEHFHKYYYTYKFFEFMPYLNLSQVWFLINYNQYSSINVYKYGGSRLMWPQLVLSKAQITFSYLVFIHLLLSFFLLQSEHIKQLPLQYIGL